MDWSRVSRRRRWQPSTPPTHPVPVAEFIENAFPTQPVSAMGGMAECMYKSFGAWEQQCDDDVARVARCQEWLAVFQSCCSRWAAALEESSGSAERSSLGSSVSGAARRNRSTLQQATAPTFLVLPVAELVEDAFPTPTPSSAMEKMALSMYRNLRFLELERYSDEEVELIMARVARCQEWLTVFRTCCSRWAASLEEPSDSTERSAAHGCPSEPDQTPS